jgi:GntR family transcriptional regulator
MPPVVVPTLDRESPVPLYFQLKQLLMARIEAGDWTPGTLIPSEQELQDTYDLSRTTVRQTLSELVAEGLLMRQRGRGTFIAQPKVSYTPASGVAFSNFVDDRGVELAWRLLERGWGAASPPVAEMLGVAAGSRVYSIQRLRLAEADGDAIGYHVAYLIPEAADAIEEAALTTGDSFQYLRAYAGMTDARIDRTLEARAADDRDRRLLGLERGAPVLQLERRLIDAAGKPIEYLHARFRGDRFKYRISLNG